jgi:hypothetical protein
MKLSSILKHVLDKLSVFEDNDYSIRVGMVDIEAIANFPTIWVNISKESIEYAVNGMIKGVTINVDILKRVMTIEPDTLSDALDISDSVADKLSERVIAIEDTKCIVSYAGASIDYLYNNSGNILVRISQIYTVSYR